MRPPGNGSGKGAALAQRGHAAPVSIQAAISAPNCACVPGAGSRWPPGRQPQPTSESCAMCSWICASVLPPLRPGSLICSQICASDRVLPRHARRRDVPEGMAGNAGRLEVGRLVAGRAAHADGALVVGAAHDQRAVRMHVGALRRPLAHGMAVEAARVLDHLAGLDEEGARSLAPVGDRGEAVGVAQVGRVGAGGERGEKEHGREAGTRVSIHDRLSTGRGEMAHWPGGQCRPFSRRLQCP